MTEAARVADALLERLAADEVVAHRCGPACAEAKHDLIFYKRRSTPKVVTRGAPAPDNPPSGWGAYDKRLQADDRDEKDIAAGRWVRKDRNGNRPSDSGYSDSQYRSWLPRGGSGGKSKS